VTASTPSHLPPTLGELRDELGRQRDELTYWLRKAGVPAAALMVHEFENAVRDAAFEEVQRMTGKRGQA